MRKYIRSSANSAKRLTSIKITAAHESDAMFTLENVAEILSQIPELSNYNIGIGESPDGISQLLIGDTIYGVVGG